MGDAKLCFCQQSHVFVESAFDAVPRDEGRGGSMVSRLYTKAQTWLADMCDRARREVGATAVEYGLLVALIAAVIVLIVGALGRNVSLGFSRVNATI